MLNENSTKFLSWVLAFGSVMTPALLLTGYSYNIGYLSVFSLSPDVVHFSFYDGVGTAFYLSLKVIVELLIRVHWLFYLIGSVVFIPVAFGVLGTKFEFYWAKRLIEWLQLSKGETSSRIMNTIEVGNNLVGIFLTLVVLLPFVFVALPLKKGVDDGKEHLVGLGEGSADCVDFSINNVSCVVIKDLHGKVYFSGLFLLGTESHIALYDGKDSQVIPRASNLIVQISSPALKIESDKL